MKYIYRGDRHTDPAFKGKPCDPVFQAGTDKCIRGKNANMVVRFECGTVVVVNARQLRLWKKP